MKSRLAALVLLVPLGLFALNGCASASISSLGDEEIAATSDSSDDANDPDDSDDDADDSGETGKPTLPADSDDADDSDADSSDDYPAQVRTNYLTSCQAGDDDMKDYCECTLDKLESSHTLEEFEQLEKDYAAGDSEASTVIVEVSSACFDKIG